MKFLIVLLSACSTLNAVPLNAQTYFVKKVLPHSIGVNGKGDAGAWSKANILTDFTYPWDSIPAPATSFAAVWDGDWLYCVYHVKDDSVITHVGNNTKMDIGASDRVEIFFKANDSMSTYYCLELDATARIFDYNAAYYRKMNYAWQWPEKQLIVKSSSTQDGYIVEFAISIKSLKSFGLLNNGRLQAGLFRAECKGPVKKIADEKWISWVKPRSPQPDFHIPSAFGVLVLEE